jgi:hypothetical protein
MPTHDHDGNGWNEYQRLVLSKLDELTEKADAMQAQLHRQNMEIAVMRVKSSVLGAVAGCVTAIVTLAVAYLRSFKS